MRRFFVAAVVFIFLAGCAPRCLLMHSEYCDITGNVYAPKSSEEPIKIYEPQETVPTPYEEIGCVRVTAAQGTDRSVLREEMIRRARRAGADALIRATYGEDSSSNFVFCGKVFSTKKNISAVAHAIVFKTKKSSSTNIVDKIAAEP